jgi:uncharacterized SAM-binding protein YcdF (DUF218 family)
MPSPVKIFLRAFRWLSAAVIVLALGWLFWGADLLITSDPRPPHVDSAVVLQGSVVAEKVRVEGAINLLRQGIAGHVLLSLPQESYWGQSVAPIARSYLEHKYGADIAGRLDFCETSEDVDSTAQEAQVLRRCIQERGWRSIIVVTSNYHTRRARIIWRKALKPDPHIQVWIEGVNDPEFRRPWWRYRQSAKVFVMESAKLVWTMCGG